MSNKLNLFRKLWGKNKSDNGSTSKLEPKVKDFFHITFENHENPEASFTLDLGDKHPVFNRLSDVKNTQDNEEEMEVIMNPKQKRESKIKEREDVTILFEPPQNSIVLTQPQVITWKNKEAYVYRMESEYNKDGERPDLEFVIYIPIDTAVKWLDGKIEKTPYYDSSNANNDKKGTTKSPEKQIKYGGEENDQSNHALVTWNNINENNKYVPDVDKDKGKTGMKNPDDDKDKGKTGMKNMSEFFDSDSDEYDKMGRNTVKPKGNKGKDEEDKDKTNRKPDKAKENKVKVPPMTKKKARRVTTIYEEEEDSVSLGRLRPRLQDKKAVQIVEKKKLSL